MRRSQPRTNGEDLGRCDLLDAPKAAVAGGIPFVQRLTCTIAEACEVTGLGRTKLYELIGDGKVSTTTIGRRRLVLVQSLLSLIEGNRSRAGRA
jgi:excisionase family DNA binding protein